MAGKHGNNEILLVDDDGSVLDNINAYFLAMSKGRNSARGEHWWPRMPTGTDFKTTKFDKDHPLCSPVFNDRRFGNIVMTSSPSYKAFQKHLLKLVEGVALGYLSKDIVCMCQYVLENVQIQYASAKTKVILPTTRDFGYTLKKASWLADLGDRKKHWPILSLLFTRTTKFSDYLTFLEVTGAIPNPNTTTVPIARSIPTNGPNKLINVIGVQNAPQAPTIRTNSAKTSSNRKLKEITARLNAWYKDTEHNPIDDLYLKDLFRIDGKPSFLGSGHGINNQAIYTMGVRGALYRYILEDKLGGSEDSYKMIDMFNPWTCTVVTADLMEAPPRPFLDIKLGDILKFANLQNTGQCFSSEYYGQAILTNYGNITFQRNVNLADPKNSSIRNYFIKAIIPVVGAHYASLPITDVTKKDFVGRVAKSLNTRTLLDLLKKQKPDKSHLLFESASGTESSPQFKSSAFQDRNAVTALFTILFTSYGNIIMPDNLKKVYDELGEGVFNMIAMIGYIFTSDNLCAQKGTTHDFHVSLACVEEWTGFRRALDTIMMKGTTQTVAQFLNDHLKIAVNNTSVDFDSLTDDIIGSCIHGAGYRMNCRYLSAYHHLQARGAKCELAPFYVKVPIHLKAKGAPMEGLDYLSCCNNDKFTENGNCNPVNMDFFVSGYKVSPDGNTCSIIQLMEIRNNIDRHYSAHKQGFFNDVYEYVETAASRTCMIPQMIPYVEKGALYPTSVATTATAALCLPQNRQIMIDLLRIPALFTKQRKLNFILYRDYVLHSYRIMHEISPSSSKALQNRYARWKETIASHTEQKTNTNTLPYDVAEASHVRYTERGRHEMLRTFLAYKTITGTNGGKNTIKYMLNTNYNTNANTENSDNYDIMNNFFEVEYGSEGKVRHPLNPSKDMTRVYQYLTILGKMLNPQRIFRNVCIIDSTSTLEQCMDTYRLLESYYGMFNPAFTCSTKLFSNLSTCSKTEGGVTTHGITNYDINRAVQWMTKKSPDEKARDSNFAHHLHLLKSLQNATIFNVDKALDAITTSVREYHPTTVIEITTDFKLEFPMQEIIKDEIETYMNTFVYLMFCMLPDFMSYGGRKQMTQAMTHLRNMNNNNAHDDKSFFLMFWRALAFVTTTFICGEGNLTSTYQYHFTEVMRDARFYVDLKKFLDSTQPAVSSADWHDHSLLGMMSSTKLKTMYDKTRHYLQTNVAYYNEGGCTADDARVRHHTDPSIRETMSSYKDVSITRTKEDYQDTIPVVLEAMVKAHLVDVHRMRFQKLTILQNFIDRYILGETMLTVTGEIVGPTNMLVEPYCRALHIFWILRDSLWRALSSETVDLAKLVASQLQNYAMGFGSTFEIGNP